MSMDVTENTGGEKVRKDGKNIKHLIDMFGLTQTRLSELTDIAQSTLSIMLMRDIIDDEHLEKIAGAIGHGFTAECIKNYDHEDTKQFVIQNVYQTVNEGGKAYNSGSQDQSSVVHDGGKNYNSGSKDESSIINNPLEAVIKLAEELRQSEVMKMYYRMKVEPEAVEKEIKDNTINYRK